ncbi:uncharacterized protein LOC119737400 isoform X4 [Patiria miniata]|uniref:PDZ domain-containing protein n=1 Tax=Patiria miniata TaxID=46514 RepID=A0A914AV71_PATMI|nr:uncharacterized protein LOC119737400 isoform X4 [Patiria miniata]
MENVVRKRQGTSQEKTQSPDEAAREPRSAQGTSQADASEFSDHVFLNNFKVVDGAVVDFHADLNDKDGQYVFQNVAEDGLAYSAGFRTGDRLFQINGTNIEGFGIEFILDLLRTFHGYQVPQLLLAVERKPEIVAEPSVFLWVIFKVIWQDDIPKIEVIQTHKTDSEEMPYFDLLTYSWAGPPVNAYDIYIDGTTQLYLSIKGDNIVFDTYNPKSMFRGYSYFGGQPKNGNVLAYSLQSLQPVNKTPRPGTTLAGTADNTVSVTDFPEFMLGDEITEDPRLWYQKHYKNGFSFESTVAKGMYLAMAPNGVAMLSENQTELKVNRSTMTASKLEPSCAMTKV